MTNRDSRTALKADIAAHLLENGPKKWTMLQERYPKVSPATFWRVVKEVKSAPQAEIGGAAAPVRRKIPTTSREDFDLAVMGSQAIPPPCLTAAGSRDELLDLLADAELLRDYSFDSTGKLTSPEAFKESAKMREKILRIFVAQEGTLRKAEEIDLVNKEISDIILQEIPAEVREAVLRKMAEAARRYYSVEPYNFP